MTSRTQDKNSDTSCIAIYGVGKLARLYREFTRESVFTTSRKLQLKPTMGGSFFGGADKETTLCKKSFRAISSLVCRSDEHIEGVLPIGKLFYFRAENQKYYQSRAPQYYRLVKRYFYDLDKNSTGECLWCFFPMVHSENNHLTVGEIGAYVIWFEVPQRGKATVYDLDRFR